MQASAARVSHVAVSDPWLLAIAIDNCDFASATACSKALAGLDVTCNLPHWVMKH